MGGAGSPGYHPLTHLVAWGRRPFPEEIERRVLYLRDVSPGALDKIDLAEFIDWQNGRNLNTAYAHLDELIDDHKRTHFGAFGDQPKTAE